jgi:hypothetical protein
MLEIRLSDVAIAIYLFIYGYSPREEAPNGIQWWYVPLVGSEEARRSASLRPPLKLDMQFYRIQLSRKRGLPRCN